MFRTNVNPKTNQKRCRKYKGDSRQTAGGAFGDKPIINLLNLRVTVLKVTMLVKKSVFFTEDVLKAKVIS